MALHGLYSINQIMEILDDLGTPMTRRSVQRRLKNRSIDHAGNANLYTSKTVTDLIHAEGPDSYKEATPGQIKADQIRVNLLKKQNAGKGYFGPDLRVQETLGEFTQKFMLAAIFYDGAVPHKMNTEQLTFDIQTMYTWEEDGDVNKVMPANVLQASNRLNNWRSYVTTTARTSK